MTDHSCRVQGYSLEQPNLQWQPATMFLQDVHPTYMKCHTCTCMHAQYSYNAIQEPQQQNQQKQSQLEGVCTQRVLTMYVHVQGVWT